MSILLQCIPFPSSLLPSSSEDCLSFISFVWQISSQAECLTVFSFVLQTSSSSQGYLSIFSFVLQISSSQGCLSIFSFVLSPPQINFLSVLRECGFPPTASCIFHQALDPPTISQSFMFMYYIQTLKHFSVFTCTRISTNPWIMSKVDSSLSRFFVAFFSHAQELVINPWLLLLENIKHLIFVTLLIHKN